MVVAVVAGLVAILLRPGARPEQARVSGAGGPAPTFELPNLVRGEGPISLASYRGRPVVLNFWASWCDPCRREMPAFEAAHRRLGDRVAFLGIDRQDARDDGLKMRAQTRVTYPSAYDVDGSLDQAYRLRGMPSTIFLAADGRILAHVSGEVTAGRLDGLLSELYG